MTYLLDTNTCIRFLNGSSESIKEKFETHNSSDLVVCSIVVAELLFGAYKSSQPDVNLNKVQKFLSVFKSYSFNDEAAKYYGIIRSSLEKAGNSIGPNDLFIAAVTLANNFILVTHNIKEFSRIRGLQIKDWEI